MNAKLLAQIAANLTPLDTEEMYADMLDDCYPDCKIAGMKFQTSRALRELDPTAYRCGEVDYIDSLSLIEICGDYYEQDAVEAERDSLITDLVMELSELEEDILENEKDIKNEVISEEAGNAENERLQDEISSLTAHIEEIKEFSF